MSYQELFANQSSPNLKNALRVIASVATSLFAVGSCWATTVHVIDVAQFDRKDGTCAVAGITIDSSGNMYGTTAIGGINIDGVIWEIKAGTNTIVDIWSFAGTDGEDPYGGVTIDGSGNLWGTTRDGAAYGYGNIWEIKAGTDSLLDVADFMGTNGCNPEAGVTFDSEGNAWGTTYSGGAFDVGEVWEIKASTTVLIDFDDFDDKDGAYPTSGVTFDSQGNAWGTTYYGGRDNSGNIWEIKKGTLAISGVAFFNGQNGYHPTAGITIDTNGNLWGTASSGGGGSVGNVWEIKADRTTIIKVASFEGANGMYPEGGVVVDSSGNVWGTASEGGKAYFGDLWEIKAGTHKISEVAAFTGGDGGSPTGNVVMDTAGDIWGTASEGGKGGNGVIWELPATVG